MYITAANALYTKLPHMTSWIFARYLWRMEHQSLYRTPRLAITCNMVLFVIRFSMTYACICNHFGPVPLHMQLTKQVRFTIVIQMDLWTIVGCADECVECTFDVHSIDNNGWWQRLHSPIIHHIFSCILSMACDTDMYIS